MFIAAEYYRGRMIVSTLRKFENEESALKYVEQFKFGKRAYELFDDKKPKLIKS